MHPLVSEGVTTLRLPRDIQAAGKPSWGLCAVVQANQDPVFAWITTCLLIPDGFNVKICSKIISTNCGLEKQSRKFFTSVVCAS